MKLKLNATHEIKKMKTQRNAQMGCNRISIEILWCPNEMDAIQRIHFCALIVCDVSRLNGHHFVFIAFVSFNCLISFSIQNMCIVRMLNADT